MLINHNKIVPNSTYYMFSDILPSVRVLTIMQIGQQETACSIKSSVSIAHSDKLILRVRLSSIWLLVIRWSLLIDIPI